MRVHVHARVCTWVTVRLDRYRFQYVFIFMVYLYISNDAAYVLYI